MICMKTHRSDIDLRRGMCQQDLLLFGGEVVVVSENENWILRELEVPAVNPVLLQIHEGTHS